MRKYRISEIIGNINEKYVGEATVYSGNAKALRHTGWIKWGAIAACLVLVVVLGIGVFQRGVFGVKEHIATLDNGSAIHFIKSGSAMKQLDIAFQLESRKLTKSEINTLFRGLPVTADALFHAENESIVGLRGSLGNVKLIVSAPGVMLNDTVIEGEERVSDVDGISVHAGYFITRANSRGKKNIIYYAEFKMGEWVVYIEHTGPVDESEVVKNEVTSVIQDVISLEEIDLREITK